MSRKYEYVTVFYDIPELAADMVKPYYYCDVRYCNSVKLECKVSYHYQAATHWEPEEREFDLWRVWHEPTGTDLDPILTAEDWELIEDLAYDKFSAEYL